WQYESGPVLALAALVQPPAAEAFPPPARLSSRSPQSPALTRDYRTFLLKHGWFRDVAGAAKDAVYSMRNIPANMLMLALRAGTQIFFAGERSRQATARGAMLLFLGSHSAPKPGTADRNRRRAIISNLGPNDFPS